MNELLPLILRYFMPSPVSIITTLTFLVFNLSFAATNPASANIWQPLPGTSWQWQLQNSIDTSFDVQMYDIDLFDAPQATIDTLKADGRKIICYFSAGSYEEWRDDAPSFSAAIKGNPLDDWIGESWLDIRQIDQLAPIMQTRLDLAVSKGCDGVEPDNVDAYTNNSGFPLSAHDQLIYNRWLADQAHTRGLSIGLKNDLSLITELVNDFDWALNEQCYQYNECDLLTPFIDAGKAVFGVEYQEEGGNPDSYCPDANNRKFSWLQKTYDLSKEVITDCSSYKILGFPYDQARYQPLLNESKLQAPDSSKVKEGTDFANYSSDFFYLDNTDLMTFKMSGDGKRSELRQLKEWKTSDIIGNTLYGRVNIDLPTASQPDEFTWMQVHDKPYDEGSEKFVEGSPNKPLVRLFWQKVRTVEGEDIEDHLWAAVYRSVPTDDTIKPEKIDLGKRPDGLFDSLITIKNNILTIEVNNTKKVLDVSFWQNFHTYFKAGVYLQGDGEATVQFNQLKYDIPFSWDIDGDDSVKPLTDGLLVLRYQFGFRGETLINNAIDNQATRTNANTIESYMQNAVSFFDIDGDGVNQPLTDGLLLLRYLFGFRGGTLIQNAVGSSAERQTATSIQDYIESHL